MASVYYGNLSANTTLTISPDLLLFLPGGRIYTESSDDII